MDHATREFSLVFRRLLGALLGITLLVAFWADRPLAAESYPAAERAAAASPPPAGAEPPPTSLVSWARRPWLAFYTLAGAPRLDQGRLTPAQQARFRQVVGTLAAAFFAAGGVLWWRGSRAIVRARHP
jgi:hypothetical protein